MLNGVQITRVSLVSLNGPRASARVCRISQIELSLSDQPSGTYITRVSLVSLYGPRASPHLTRLTRGTFSTYARPVVLNGVHTGSMDLSALTRCK